MRGLTVDLEDWFQVYNFSKIVNYADWDKQEARIIKNTKKILSILDEYDAKATFFVLGWIAERYPSLVLEIKDKGHEIACHGYSHKLVYTMGKEEFAEDLDKAINAITKVTGEKPKGFRAPSFSIVRMSFWALDVLREKGFEYDSSMVPVKHPDYGVDNIPKKPFSIKGILEIPLVTQFGLPVGGGYFRVYPYWLTKFLLKRNKNAVFYIHPWEFDPGMPKYKLPLLKRFRHYVGLKKTEKKFRKLLRDFKFIKMEDLILPIQKANI